MFIAHKNVDILFIMCLLCDSLFLLLKSFFSVQTFFSLFVTMDFNGLDFNGLDLNALARGMYLFSYI